MQTINKTQYQCAELRRSVPVLQRICNRHRGNVECVDHGSAHPYTLPSLFCIG